MFTWFRNMRVGAKIIATAMVALMVALFIGTLGIMRLASVAESAEAIYEQGVKPVDSIGLLRREVNLARLNAANHALSLDASAMTKYEADIKETDARLDEVIEGYRPMANDVDKLNEFVSVLSQYRNVRDSKLIPLGKANDIAAWTEVRDEESGPLTTRLSELMSELHDLEITDAENRRDNAQTTYESARMFIILSLLIGIALATTMALAVTRMVTRPLSNVVRSLKAMADGDLTIETPVESKDELGVMAEAMGHAQAGMKDALQKVAGNAQSLASAAEQLTGTSMAIASSAEESSAQASSAASAAEQVSTNLGTVSAAAEQMGASIQQIASSSQDAARVAAGAVAAAEATSNTMARLGTSSAEIGDVMKVITGIAQQTNLLALNATIEAARAGEAGKGFAVVASEVKDLAMETAKATEDIQHKIAAIQQDTEGAVVAMEQIRGVITQINDYQTSIASAVEEQTATTSEMTRNVNEAAMGSQEIAQSAATVAEAAGQTSRGVVESQQAADSLSRMSAELEQLVGTFRL
jgi:methyl-accepting chemotaxis protein